MPAMPGAQAARVLEELVAVCREEREAVEHGRLELLPEIVSRRGMLLAELDVHLPAGTPVVGRVAELLEEAKAAVRGNLELLGGLRDELSRRLSEQGTLQRAAAGYEAANGY